MLKLDYLHALCLHAARSWLYAEATPNADWDRMWSDMRAKQQLPRTPPAPPASMFEVPGVPPAQVRVRGTETALSPDMRWSVPSPARPGSAISGVNRPALWSNVLSRLDGRRDLLRFKGPKGGTSIRMLL